MDVFAAGVTPSPPPIFGGDASKYDGRHLRDRFRTMQRVGCALLALLLLVLLTGDSLLLRGSARKGAKLALTPGEHVRPAGARADAEFGALMGAAFPSPRTAAPKKGPPPPPRAGPATREEILSAMDAELGEMVAAYDAVRAAEAARGDVDLTAGAAAPEGGGPTPSSPPNVAGSPDAMWQPVTTDKEGCGFYFGHGYEDYKPLVGEGPGAQFWCRQHTRTKAWWCGGRNIIIHHAGIAMSKGGETLSSVMGRGEDEELPVFGAGAIEIPVKDPFVKPEGGGPADCSHVGTEGDQIFNVGNLQQGMSPVDPYKWRMMGSVRVLPKGTKRQCDTVVTAPVIFLTRVEYVNLFHTSTDWYNAWQIARLNGLTLSADYAEDELAGLTEYSAAMEKASPRRVTPRFAAHIVFIDGHNAGPMDEGWRAMFLSLNYVKHLKPSACFATAIFAPYGYHAAISQGMGTMGGSCRGDPHIRQFGFDMVTALGITPKARSTCAEDITRILFVRRVDYTVHPRHDGKIVRRLDNEGRDICVPGKVV